MEEHIIADKTLIRTAKVISAVFTPFSIPFLAFLVLFIFSYLRIILTITSYVFCLLMMHRLNIPWYMTGIILSALVVMIICVIVNLKWKLSEHMAGAGAVIGGLVAFSALFSYNPVWWLCLFILVAGVLGTARIILRHHTLGEVMGGFAVGLICSLLVLHPLSNILFRIFLF